MFILWFSVIGCLISSNRAANVPLLPVLLSCISLICIAATSTESTAAIEKALESLPTSVDQHLYTFNGELFYLPPAAQTDKLFESVSINTIKTIMSGDMSRCQRMFVIPILVDYIIPFFRGEMINGNNVIAALPNIIKVLQKPIDQLLWAIFFSYRTTQRALSPVLDSVTKKFHVLGFAWKDLRKGLANAASFEKWSNTKSHNMLPIFMAAKCFGLDTNTLASMTSGDSILSRQILNDNGPACISQTTAYDCLQVFYAVFEGNPVSIHSNTPLENEIVREPLKKVKTNLPREEIADPIVFDAPSAKALRYLPDALYQIPPRVIDVRQDPLHILQHAYYNDAGFLVYLPPDDGLLLFERLSYETVRSTMEINAMTNPYFFSLAIVRDYIIPAFQDRTKLITIRLSLQNLPGITTCLRPFLERVLWAAYFADGRVDRVSSILVEEFVKILSHFGLNWHQMRKGGSRTETFENNEGKERSNIMRTFFLARWICFDLRRIAQRTRKLGISEHILAENIPDQLLNSVFPSCAELFYILYGSIPAKDNTRIETLHPRGPKKRILPEEIGANPPAKRLKVVHENLLVPEPEAIRPASPKIPVKDPMVPEVNDALLIVDPKNEGTFVYDSSLDSVFEGLEEIDRDDYMLPNFFDQNL